MSAPWAKQQFFEAQPLEPWQNDIEKRRAFGIELAKLDSTQTIFQVALKVLNESQKALWATHFWINDPVVVAAKDAYLAVSEVSSKLLDKHSFAAKLLSLADEKSDRGIPLHETKDRLAALKLYSDVMGFTGKVDINASTNILNNNEIKITFVKPEEKEPIDITPNSNKNESEILTDLPIQVKLVG